MSHLMPRRLVAFAAAAILVVACSGAAAPSFDPTGPCTADGAAPGAYPELEALVPDEYEGRAPDLLDSGRNCTDANLGSLAGHDIDEVRFAGGTWDFGSDIAVVLAVFTADGLTVEALTEWWETSARESPRTEVTGVSTVDVAGVTARRIDTKTGERLQTVVVWPGDEQDQVNVVLSHNVPDPKIEAAVGAFEGR